MTKRERILDAAFAAFMKSGYATTSTLEIATRARVSKRELYAEVGNKQEILIACISERATRLKVPADLPVPHDRETSSCSACTGSGRNSSGADNDVWKCHLEIGSHGEPNV